MASLFRLCRLSLAALLLGGSMIALAAPSTAGTNNPVAVDPYVHQQVTSQPDAVTIAFTTVVRQSAYIVVEDPSGANVAKGDPRLESTNMSVSLKPGLPAGTYTVKYRVEGSNGPEGGSYQFAIGSGNFTIKAINTWGGYKEIPKGLRLPGDKAAEAQASATPPTPSTTPSATGTSSSEATDGSSGIENKADSASTGSSWLPWTIGVVVVVIIGSIAFVARRRSA